MHRLAAAPLDIINDLSIQEVHLVGYTIPNNLFDHLQICCPVISQNVPFSHSIKENEAFGSIIVSLHNHNLVALFYFLSPSMFLIIFILFCFFGKRSIFMLVNIKHKSLFWMVTEVGLHVYALYIHSSGFFKKKTFKKIVKNSNSFSFICLG